jgi:RNA polymerase sigma factor (sigma-70 family)
MQGFNDLLQQARGRDPEAQERLMRLVLPYLERQAGAMAGTSRASQSSSDLAQEALLRVWQKLDQFGGTGVDEESWAMFCAWAGQIVRRLGINSLRDRNAQRRRPPERVASLQEVGAGPGRRPADPPADDPTASALLRDAEQTELVRAALERAGDVPGLVVRLHFFEGLTLREIASRLDLTYDQVRERFQMGLRRLERELGPQP